VDERLNIKEIESEDFSKAIHTLKGVSGNISLKDIYKLSQEIYTTDENDRKLSLTIQLISLMKETIQKLKNQFTAYVEQTKDKVYTQDEKKIFMKEFIEDLSHSRVISSSRIESAIEIFKEDMREDSITKLKVYLVKYKYKEAYQLIEKYSGKFNDKK
jgi:HPt (histidine-containing phosphotransfer) domain-containing protein